MIFFPQELDNKDGRRQMVESIFREKLAIFRNLAKEEYSIAKMAEEESHADMEEDEF